MTKPEDCNHAPATGKGLIPADKRVCGYCGVKIVPAHGTYIPQQQFDEITKDLEQSEPQPTRKKKV